jgi:ABC-type transport system substrate-binding protein
LLKERGESEMSKKIFAIVAIAILCVSTFGVLPAAAWVYPDGTSDGKFELYGPHNCSLLVRLFADEEAEWREFDRGTIDITDWPLTPAWINTWKTDPRFILADYGGEYGYFILDMNHNGTVLHWDGIRRDNPLTDINMRIAIAYAVNRSYIVHDICEDLALPMWTVIPPAFGYAHPQIKPGGTLEALTYGGWMGDLTAGKAALEAGHFRLADPDGYRYWDKNNNGQYDGPSEWVQIIVYARSDSLQRLAFADYLVPKLRDDYKLRVDYHPQPRPVCSDEVFGAKRYHLYTGGWILSGPEPDFLYDLYHIDNYWHPGKPPNYGWYGGDDALLCQYAYDAKFAPSEALSLGNATKFQERFAGMATAAPLWCASGVKAFRKLADNGEAWKGVVNEQGFGINSWYSTLNMHPDTNYYWTGTMTYGFKTLSVDWLNPVYAEWYWDYEVIGRIYDVLGGRNASMKVSRVEQLANWWEAGEWVDPVDGQTKTKVTFTLRPDVYWTDGTPVSIADVWFTFIELVDILESKDLIPPWWYPTVSMFKSYYIKDAYTMEILMDVYSVWALGWVLGTVVLPKHVWKPIALASTQANNLIHEQCPDPNLIGTGPFRLASYVEGSTILMVPNYKGSIVTTNMPGATPTGPSPGYYQWYPVNIKIIGPEKSARILLTDTTTTATFTVELRNLWLNQCSGGFLVVDKYVYLNGELLSGFPKTVTLVTEPDGQIIPDIEPITLTLTKCKHTLTVAVHIKGPAKLDELHDNPWICNWVNQTFTFWVTIKEDIAGDVFDPWHTPPEITVPDCTVEITDVATAAYAFGSYPGHSRWSSISDLNGDYSVDISDIASIAYMFGW